MFYAQSTGAVISGRYTSHIVYLIFNNVYVLKWVYIQFLKPCLKGENINITKNDHYRASTQLLNRTQVGNFRKSVDYVHFSTILLLNLPSSLFLRSKYFNCLLLLFFPLHSGKFRTTKTDIFPVADSIIRSSRQS